MRGEKFKVLDALILAHCEFHKQDFRLIHGPILIEAMSLAKAGPKEARKIIYGRVNELKKQKLIRLDRCCGLVRTGDSHGKPT